MSQIRAIDIRAIDRIFRTVAATGSAFFIMSAIGLFSSSMLLFAAAPFIADQEEDRIVEFMKPFPSMLFLSFVGLGGVALAWSHLISEDWRDQVSEEEDIEAALVAFDRAPVQLSE